MLQGHGGNISAVARQFGVRPSEIIDMSNQMVAETLSRVILDAFNHQCDSQDKQVA
jgi:hypothetical protein